jgi:hypothetical protein
VIFLLLSPQPHPLSPGGKGKCFLVTGAPLRYAR